MSYLLRSPFHFAARFPGRSLLFVLIVTVLLLCMHGLFFVSSVLDHTSQIVRDRLTLTLYVRSEYSQESRNMRNFTQELQALPTPVSSTYITKDVALDQELQRNPDLLSILSGENPLPDSLILDISQDNIEGLDSILDRYSYLFVSKDEESYQAYLNQIESIRGFQKNFLSIRIAVGGLLGVFIGSIAFFAFLFLQNHSFLFQRELKVALLSGASSMAIAGPYILFCVLLVAIAYVIALFLSIGVGSMWPLSLFTLPQSGGPAFTYDVFLISSWGIFLVELALLVLISFLSGFLSLAPVFRRLKR